MKRILGFLMLLGVAFSLPSPLGGIRTLVVLESDTLKTTHKIFFDSLTAQGYDLSFRMNTAMIKLNQYEEPLYDNIILFAPKVNEFGGELSTVNLLNFMKKGGNILVAGGVQVGNAVRDLAFEFGVEFDDKGSVIDHFNVSPKDDGSHTLIYSKNILDSKAFFSTPLSKPVLFKGTPHILKDNKLVFSVLGGNPTSFAGTKNAIASSPFALGRETGLVSSLQARNNARLTISGSILLFSDSYMEDETGDNKKFADSIVGWTFQEKGVLRTLSSSHSKVGESHPPRHYIITDQMEFHIAVEEWTGKEWKGFSTSDMQLEVKMLDPQIRTTLESDSKGNFTKTVVLPDVYGVFTFSVDYRRIGYSFVGASHIVPVYPLRHDQYERFIGAAYPYYFACLSFLLAFFLLSSLFLFNRDPSKVKTA